jgi:cardiolipin synthase (CMP-forming)
MSLIPPLRITWPTMLTFARFILIPFIVISVVHQQWGWALFLFSIASGTDFFDGFFARRFHLSTKLGALLDGLADKFLMLSLLVTFSFVSTLLPTWFVNLLLVKEMVVLGAAALLLQHNYVIVIAPLLLGKVTMAAKMILFAWMMLCLLCSLPFSMWLVQAVAVLVVLTLISYLLMVIRLKRKHES